jgi:phosphoribosyl-AMP cyclohydrolase
MNDWLDEIHWNEDGLVPAIAQDHKTGRILMMAWMNRESLALTVSEQRAIDCDADVIVLMVEQLGGIACHTGRESCFYRVYENGGWKTVDAVLKDPHAIYAGHSHE